MSERGEAELDPPFEILEPAGGCAGPLVFNSPHSGRIYPAAFLRQARLPLRSAAPLRGHLRR